MIAVVSRAGPVKDLRAYVHCCRFTVDFYAITQEISICSKRVRGMFYFVLQANDYAHPQNFLPLQGLGLHLHTPLQNNGGYMPCNVV